MKNKIVELLQNSLKTLEIDGVDIYVETPKNTDNGDFSSNVAMQLTRVLRKNPRVIAEEIIANIPADDAVPVSDILSDISQMIGVFKKTAEQYNSQITQ